MHDEHFTLIEVEALRPTQMTVGFAEVQLKRLQWRSIDPARRAHFLDEHVFPAVVGPKGHHFILDHHHLGRALLDERAGRVPVLVKADFQALDKDEFWVVMDHRQWVHPYDADGNRLPFKAMPKTLGALTDDPYRSLAAAVREAGGFPKDQTPFAEFLWADFFRRRIALDVLENEKGLALTQALQLAHDPAAAHLPGWSGVAAR